METKRRLYDGGVIGEVVEVKEATYQLLYASHVIVVDVMQGSHLRNFCIREHEIRPASEWEDHVRESGVKVSVPVWCAMDGVEVTDPSPALPPYEQFCSMECHSDYYRTDY